MIRIANVPQAAITTNNYNQNNKNHPSFCSSKEEMARIVLEKKLGKTTFFTQMTNYIGEVQKAFSGLKGGDSFITANLTGEKVLPEALSELRIFSKKTPFKTFGEFNQYMNQPFNPTLENTSRKEQLNELLKIYEAYEPDTVVINKIVKPKRRCTLCEEKERGRITTELEGIKTKLNRIYSKQSDFNEEYYQNEADIKILQTRKSQILNRINEIDT